MEFILIVVAAAVFDIAVKFPMPVFVPDMMLLVVIVRVPVLPEFTMPLNTEAPVPYTEQFWIVLPVTDVVPVEEFVIPLNVQIGLVVVPLVPIVIELLVVVLPMVFDAIVKLPAAPAVLMPWKVYPIKAVPPVLIDPILLFCIDTVPVELAYIPAI